MRARKSVARASLVLVAILFALSAGCEWPTMPAQELKITVQNSEGEKVKVDSDEPSKMMEVYNPEMEFSPFCKLYDGKAYIQITSISGYSIDSLWGDFQLLKAQGITDVRIYMNSPGGSAFAGHAMADELRLAKEGLNLTVEGRGLIASAAVPVFVMADRRIVSKNTIFLIHPAKLWKWGIFQESLEDLQSQSKMIKMLQEIYAETISERSNLSEQEVLDLMTCDNWFTAEEALDMGLVDEIR